VGLSGNDRQNKIWFSQRGTAWGAKTEDKKVTDEKGCSNSDKTKYRVTINGRKTWKKTTTTLLEIE